MKFAEIPGRLSQLLFPPDPIIINHTISVEGADQKKTSCYDIDVEVDDNLKVISHFFVFAIEKFSIFQVIIIFLLVPVYFCLGIANYFVNSLLHKVEHSNFCHPLTTQYYNCLSTRTWNLKERSLILFTTCFQLRL